MGKLLLDLQAGAQLLMSARRPRHVADRGAGLQDKEVLKLLLDMKAGA